MSKKLNLYIIRLFISPFLAIFSTLFFIFIIQFFWSKLNEFTGKGLDAFTISKLLFYFGLSLVPLVTPIAVLLTSIMTYGTLGEHYELAAMKSTGISLWQMMKPLFLLTIAMAIGLYFFSDHAVPAAQRKGKNLAYNISRTQPTLNFTIGTFIHSIPNVLMKIDKKIGKNKDRLEGIFIRHSKNIYEAQNTILAKRGLLTPAEDPRYIRLELFNGTVYTENRNSQDYNEQQKQPYQITKFDTLIQYFEIPSLMDQNLEEENFKDNYSMLNTQKLIERIKTIKQEKREDHTKFQKQSYATFSPKHSPTKEGEKNITPININDFNNLPFIDKKHVLENTQNQLKDFTEILYIQEKLNEQKKYLAKYELELQRKFSFAITCIVMFFIGAPLGAIIRKGGMGLPVIIALIIFIIYYTILTISQNVAEKGQISPWLGAWLPNIIMLPIGLWITYKTMKDTPVIHLGHYSILKILWRKLKKIK
ncbi:MAG: LptF/LptG family permease [Flavobacteriales bacterium AspAUS03]